MKLKDCHRIENSNVCCIGHFCEWHYSSVKEFEKHKENEVEFCIKDNTEVKK